MEYKYKILMVEAHPDDETECVGLLYKTVHRLKGIVDLAVITNGEGGYSYSYLAEDYYGLQLSKEEIGREHLPRIRKQELLNGGKIIGVRNYFLLEEKDDAYTKDIQVPLKLWDLEAIRTSLLKIMKKEKYDFVIVLLPENNTHGHHKCASLLALEVVEKMDPKERPIVLGAPDAPQLDPKLYIPVDGFPLTKVEENAPVFEFNRLRGFGKNNRLHYNVIARWVESEHKSQGTLIEENSAKTIEQYFYFSLNGKENIGKAKTLFDILSSTSD